MSIDSLFVVFLIVYSCLAHSVFGINQICKECKYVLYNFNSSDCVLIVESDCLVNPPSTSTENFTRVGMDIE